MQGAELVWIADDDDRREALAGVDAVAAARLADWYAYVAPWNPVEGELRQATGFRGAELTYAELLAAPDARSAAPELFTTRKEALE